MTRSAISTTSGGGTTRPSVLSTDQLGVLREMLEQQRRFRLDQLEQLQGGDRSGQLSDGDREITDSLVTGARAALRDVVDALQRMDDGRYGRCRQCGVPLQIERLEVLPQVSLCVGCQQAGQGAA
jgi:RNA polymerase-binding transcription factor DksA